MYMYNILKSKVKSPVIILIIDGLLIDDLEQEKLTLGNHFLATETSYPPLILKLKLQFTKTTTNF